MKCSLRVQNPIFVVGAGRTGTTLMRSLLSAHSRIAIAPETHFMKRVESWGGLSSGVCNNFVEFWAKFCSWVRFKDLGVDPGRCLEFIEEDHGAASYCDILSALLRAYQEKEGKPRVGEKTPRHSHYISTLFEWFPDAKVVAMVRDPRAVVASHVKIPWVTRELSRVSVREGIVLRKRILAIANCARGWKRIYCQVLPRWRNDGRVLFVNYESLVSEPAGQMSQVCAFVEEEFEPAMTSDAARSSVPPEAGKMDSEDLDKWRDEHYQRSVAPISGDSLEKWRDELNSSELALIEGICGPGMRENGYQTTLPSHRRVWGKTLSAGLRGAAEAETVARRAVSKLTGNIRGSGTRSAS